MLKTVLAGMAALMIVGTSLSFAQPSHEMRRYRPTAEDAAALTEARIAGLKAGLKLNAEQEKNWPAVEAAMRALAKQRADRIATMRQAPPRDDAAPDAIARLRRGADMMTTRAAALTRLADAAEPLYKSLDDGQRHRFEMLLRMGAAERPGMGGHRHWHRRADLAR
jgi:hypothetical protein